MTRTCSSRAAMLVALLPALMPLHGAGAQAAPSERKEPAPITREAATLRDAANEAQVKLQQTFTNLRFEEFGRAPVEGPIYQASAGGRIIYYAPRSEHLLFATVYDRNGVNLTALAQEQGAARRLKAIDPAKHWRSALKMRPRSSNSPTPTVLIVRPSTASGAPRRLKASRSGVSFSS